VKNEDLVLEDIWRRGDCESGAGGNTVRELNCDEEGRCWRFLAAEELCC
jgi:hypothetical protein